MRPIRIIVSCPAGANSSMILKLQIEDIFKKKKQPYDLKQVASSVLKETAASFDPDFIFSTVLFPFEFPAHQHAMAAMPLFTGVGMDEFVDKVFKIIEEEIYEN